jgi:GAG-pre-integrase domain
MVLIVYKLVMVLVYRFNTLGLPLYSFLLILLYCLMFFMCLTSLTNLISLSKLLQDNPHLTIIFSSSTCIFKDLHTKIMLLQVLSSNGLFTISPNPSSTLPQAFHGSRVSSDLWYHRLGHPSPTTTLQVINSFSLPCNSKKISAYHECSIAKSHKLPFLPSISVSHAPLEIVHSNVWGPSPICSNNGYHYYIIFVDDFS